MPISPLDQEWYVTDYMEGGGRMTTVCCGPKHPEFCTVIFHIGYDGDKITLEQAQKIARVQVETHNLILREKNKRRGAADMARGPIRTMNDNDICKHSEDHSGGIG